MRHGPRPSSPSIEPSSRRRTNGPHANAPPAPPAFAPWVEAAFERHLAELDWSEIARGLAALTQDYVQRRHRLRDGRALAGRGKRAAFVLYYAPRHYLIVRNVLLGLGAPHQRPPHILDLGCGAGAAGAAWSGLYADAPPVLGADASSWAVAEARQTYRELGIPGRAVRVGLERLRWPRQPGGTIAAFTLNECESAVRARVLAAMQRGVERGGCALVVEPLATGITPWWQEWTDRFTAVGGRADEWHFEIELPDAVVRLGRSAGLDPRQLGARSLWLGPECERTPA